MRDIRAENNDLWMGLAALAIRSAPKEAKLLMKAIRRNDQKIANLWDEIANAD